MKFYTEELWKGINGISDVYDIEIADEIFRENIKKYNDYFQTELIRVLSKSTIELYEKYDGFHDMDIVKMQYEQNNFCILGKKLHIAFKNVKEIKGKIINSIDTLGYIEIFYCKKTNDFQIGILFSWDDSIYITCENVIATEY